MSSAPSSSTTEVMLTCLGINSIVLHDEGTILTFSPRVVSPLFFVLRLHYSTWVIILDPGGNFDHCLHSCSSWVTDSSNLYRKNLTLPRMLVDTDGQPDRAFFQKSQTFGLGQTNWAEKSWVIVGIFSQFTAAILAL